MRNNLLEIERTVVSSLMWSDEPEIEYRDVDESVFTLDVHRWIVRHIKKAKDGNYPVGLMLHKLEDTIAKKIPQWELEYTTTYLTTPMANWYMYYKDLKARKIKLEAKKMLMED